jgi:hypothetical protein
MSLDKIDALIADLRHERYRWTPVKRTYPEENGNLRPLGLPSWTDKLLQEVIRAILDAYYDPSLVGTPRFPTRTGLPYHTARRGSRMEGYPLVHRGRHLPMF